MNWPDYSEIRMGGWGAKFQEYEDEIANTTEQNLHSQHSRIVYSTYCNFISKLIYSKHILKFYIIYN